MYSHQTGKDESAPTTQADFGPPQPDEQTIRLEAYAIWEERVEDGREGTPESDWYAAIEELKTDQK